MKIEDLLATHGDAINAHTKKITDEIKASEQKRINDAVALALSEQQKRPASLAELKEIVPAAMQGRSDMLVALQEEGATVAQAHKKVAERLVAINAEIAKGAQDKGKVEASLAGAGRGAPALAITPSGGDAGEPKTYMEAVALEKSRLIGGGQKDDRLVEAMAFATVSRTRPDLLEAHNQELYRRAERREVERRTKKAGS